MTVYARISGGLGNQMFQYAAGLALAKSLERDLVIDLDSFGGEGSYGGDTPRKYELREYFGVDATQITPDQRAAFSFSQPVRRAWIKVVYRGQVLNGHPYELPWPIRQTYKVYNVIRPAHTQPTYFEPHFHFDHHFWDTQADPVYLIGHWQSWRYSEPIASELVDVFRVRDEIRARVASLAEEVRGSNSVSLHVRLTDRVAKRRYRDIFGSLGPDYYAAAIERLNSKHTDLRYFLFSDDPDSAIDMLPKGIDLTVVTGRLSTTAAEDIFLMTQCRHNVIANSSFSWWSARLNEREDCSVLAPRNWYATRQFKTRDLYPPHWITVPNR